MHGVWAAKGERPERPSAAPSYPWQCCWEAPELTRTLTRTRSLTVTPWQCCWEPEMYELWGGGAPFTQEGTAPNNTLRDARDTKARSARYTGPLTY